MFAIEQKGLHIHSAFGPERIVFGSMDLKQGHQIAKESALTTNHNGVSRILLFALLNTND